MTRVAILGATGELGGRVARLIRRWAPGVHVIGANRSGRGHPDFAVQAVDVTDADALAALASRADLLINCVGPYDHDPVTVVRACVANGCHYADLAEGPAFIDAVRAAAKEAGARQKGIAVCSGCSTMPGLAQLIASEWHADAAVSSVEATLAMASRSPATRALMTGLALPLGRKGPEGRWYTKLQRTTSVDGRAFTCGSYPAAFPADGIRVGRRRVPFRFQMGFDRAFIGRALRVFAPILGRLPRSWIPTLAIAMVPVARLAGVFGTQRGILIQTAFDRSGSELRRVEIAAGTGGLDVPAAPALWLVQRLSRMGDLPVAGRVELDQLVAWSDAKAWFESAGYEVWETER